MPRYHLHRLIFIYHQINDLLTPSRLVYDISKYSAFTFMDVFMNILFKSVLKIRIFSHGARMQRSGIRECFAKVIFGFWLLAISLYSSGSLADRDTKNLIGGYGASEAGLDALVHRPNDGPLIISQDNAQLLYVPFPTNPLNIEQTLTSLSQFFVLTTNDPDQALESNKASFGPPGTPPPAQANYFKPGEQAPTVNDKKKQQMAPFANIDVNSVLGPLVYDKDQKQTAENFINSASSLGSPLNIVDLVDQANKSKTKTTAASLSAVQNTQLARYLTSLRIYAAMQSVGLSNLYQFYAERLPSNVPDDDKNKALVMGLQGINLPNASQLQVENYMATRRLTDPQWVASLSNDSPAALLRQIAILMAENLLESYNNRMATERLTVTMSMIELQQTATLRTLLESQINSINSGKALPTTGPTS